MDGLSDRMTSHGSSLRFSLCSVTIRRLYFDTFTHLFKDLSREVPMAAESFLVHLVSMSAGLNSIRRQPHMRSKQVAVTFYKFMKLLALY